MATVDISQPYPACEEVDPIVAALDEHSGIYYDDVTGKALDPGLVREARKEEIETIDVMGVWEVMDRPRGVKIVPTRWVDVNKADDSNPYIRSRFVAKEIRRKSALTGDDLGYEYFAAMPPLAALRMLLVLMVTSTLLDLDGNAIFRQDPYVLSFVDVKRAHFCAVATRDIYVELPPELGLGPAKVARLLKSLYGCRDAGHNWELEVARVMLSIGFVQGPSNPCIYYHAGRDIRTMVHGDDFVSLGSKTNLEWFHSELSKAWTIVIRGILGPPSMAGCVQEIVILNRLLSWTSEGLELEADPRHASLIVQAMGVTGAKVTTPMVKEPADQALVEDVKLSSDWVPLYRSTTMRAAYLSQDRPDLQNAVRALAKGMSEPTERHLTALKRLARFLRHRPRLVQLFRWQESIARVDTWTDSDHAGCIRTRKSTTGVCSMLGQSCIRTYSKGQGVISLSSGESEYYGLTGGLSTALGDVSLAKDWNVRLAAHVLMDASAGIAIGSRRGLGKVKHIDTVFLWCQEVINNKRASISKRSTQDMLADVLTKPVSEPLMVEMLKRMGYHYRDGSHRLALKA